VKWRTIIVSTTKIDASLAQKMFLAAAKNLRANRDWINDLNVFPVPDGDTGSNMTMTIMSAAKAVAEIANPNMETLSKAIATGSLRGARGNSGVILSQLLRGFTKEMSGLKVLTVKDLANATVRATETAYKAVIKPKEGTILTVAKSVSDKAVEIASDDIDFETALKQIIEHAEYVLSQTPELLPVLKEAGVVDSGGQGLCVVLRGLYDALTGKVTDFSIEDDGNQEAPESKVAAGKGAAIENVDIKFGYCTEFIIMLEKEFNEETEEKFKEFLQSIGDSIVCVSLDDIVKVHVHTNHPGQAFEKALEYGQLTRMKVDNMREEHREVVVSQAELQAAKASGAVEKEKTYNDSNKASDSMMEHKQYGFVSVASGQGLADIFRGLGVDQVIEGGQTMNPSTEDILDAIEKINADVIYVLPNNKNIILAANQSVELVEDKKVVVIPSKTLPQGISAMLGWEDAKSPEENEADMNEALDNVLTGQLTYAVRDTSIDGKEIKKDDFMGLGDKGLISVGKDMSQVLEEMVEGMLSDNEDAELVTVYYGSDVTEEDANREVEALSQKFDSLDIDLQYGGQPIYYYLVSVE